MREADFPTDDAERFERELRAAFKDLPRGPGADFHARLRVDLEREAFLRRRRRAALTLRLYALLAGTLSLFILYRIPAGGGSPVAWTEPAALLVAGTFAATGAVLLLLGRLIGRRLLAESVLRLLEA